MPRDLAVGEYHAPHHFRQDHSLTQIVVLRDGAGKLVMVNRLLAFDLGKLDQLSGGGVVQLEMTLQR